MKFSIKDFFSKCEQSAGNWGLVIFTEEIFDKNFIFRVVTPPALGL